VHDVAIIGYGPVGQTLAGLLGRRGVDVVVVERFERPYGLPRAMRFDHEAMRLWQEIGFAEAIADDLLPVTRYEWYGADGELDMRFLTPEYGPSGWSFSYSFHQPSLEAALDETVRAQPTVEVRRGCALTGVSQREDHVELELSGGEKLEARFVVGADGANSRVREAAGIDFEDLGFNERWFVIDVLPDERVLSRFELFPIQFCDPRRPHVLVPVARRYRRWEFMLLPDEQAEDYQDPRQAWELLEPWLSPDEATILRHAVYEFRSRVAATMRSGRCFLAGDAAHQMPPHMGEGMCSGLRDAANLAWKLDLVLRRRAGERLLETYSTERRPHAVALVQGSREMGKVSCELDPRAAEARDARLRAEGDVAPWPFPGLGEGLSYRGPDAIAALSGRLGVQGRVEAGGRRGRLDDVVGRGFVLIARGESPRTRLTAEQLEALDAVGTHLVALRDGGLDGVADVDGVLSAWLEEHDVAAVLIRPDYYVFGAVTSPRSLPRLVDDLVAQITPVSTGAVLTNT
jgi:2-polyprenyl-6-methoxyphenol hydroxylase-like FAD-dependent oxidoreductase